MAQKQIETFETTEAAVTYLYNNPDFNGELRVLERDENPLVDCSEVENEKTHNPDLPIRYNDKTHRALWLLDRHGADLPERTLAPEQVLELSTAEEFDINKALSSVMKGGYANKRKVGIKPFYYITDKGKRRLSDFDDPATEITGESVLGF